MQFAGHSHETESPAVAIIFLSRIGAQSWNASYAGKPERNVFTS